MATFHIPGDAITSVSAAGGGSPDTGYYAAVVETVEGGQKNVFSRRVKLNVSGLNTSHFMNTPYNEEGQMYPGITESKARGMIAFTKQLFVSAGYTNEQMAQGVTDDWLVGKTVYVEWHNAKDLGAKYGEIARFITKTQLDEFAAAGKLPSVAGAGNKVAVAKAAPAAVSGIPAAPSQVSVPALAAPNPMNTGIGGVSLPPAPGLSQQIVS